MEEEKKNPMDLNGDGKVTLGEKVQYYADKAGDAIEEGVKKVYEGVKEDAEEALADAKKIYDKAADKAKDVYADAKESVDGVAEKAKAMIDDLKEKKA